MTHKLFIDLEKMTVLQWRGDIGGDGRAWQLSRSMIHVYTRSGGLVTRTVPVNLTALTVLRHFRTHKTNDCCILFPLMIVK